MSSNLPEKWLERASEDLKMAQLALKEGIFNQTCFHAQQCIEKSFKGYLTLKSNTYPRTHQLNDLRKQCQLLDMAFAQFHAACITIDQYYIPTRYPDAVPGSKPFGLPDQTEAKEALNIAKIVLKFVESRFP